MGEHNKELDLIDILQAGLGLARTCVFKAWDIAVWLIRFTFNAKWILLIFIALGVAASFFRSRPDNLRYKGEVEMRLNVNEAHFYKDQINILNFYCKDENKTALIQTLHITKNEAINLLSLNSYYYIDLFLNGTPDKIDYLNQFEVKDTLSGQMTDRLALIAISRDTAIYPILLDKLKAYLESNPIVSNENAIRLKQIDEKISLLDNEIRMLDSLRRIEYFTKEADTRAKLDQTILLSEKERRLYHNDIFELEKAKQELLRERELRPEIIRFITPFKVDPDPVNNLKSSLVKLIPLFLALGFAFALGWRFRKKLYGFLTKKD